MTKILVFLKGKEIQSLELDTAKEYFAGRSKESDILLDNVVFSRQHFKIFYTNSTWVVQALSQHSKLLHENEEVDYFVLKNEDSFSAFDYKFKFSNDIEAVQSKTETEDSETPTQEIEVLQENDAEFEEKTFVPEMASQDWSYGIPFLILKTPDGKSKTLRLEGDYWTAGRDESCDILIDDAKSSREHFEIYKKQNLFFILDKESSNGTYLNNRKISPQKELQLKSGDTIQVGKVLMIFEVRDPLFDDKITRLPAEYQHQPAPEVYMHDAGHTQKVIRLPHSASGSDSKKKILMIGAALVLVSAFFMSGEEEQKNLSSTTNKPATTASPFEQLASEQQDLVEKSYTLAKTLYTQGKYELALSEIGKVHQIIPQYKDSKEIAQFSKNAIDTLFEQQEISRQEEEQKQVVQKVSNIVLACEKNYLSTRNSSILESCLEPALELDPENAKAKSLFTIAEQDEAAKEERQEQAAAYRAKIQRRKAIFNQAQNLQRKGKVLDAIATYNRHIASVLPDPDNLENQSKKEVQALKQKLSEEIKVLRDQAANAYEKKDFKNAIKNLISAIKISPQDQSLKDKHAEYSRELYKIVKTLYADSVLEENLGNIEAAKEKWKKIKETDVEYGDYYKKATSKLRKYGA